MSGKSNGGEVEYLLVADYSNLDSDLEKANQKVKKAAKESADDSVKIEEQKTKDIKKESDKVVKDAEKAADDVVSEWKEAGQDAAKAISKIGDEDVVFDVNADTGEAENKIKSVSKDKSIDVDVNADVSDAEDSIRGLGDVADDVGDEIGASISGNLGSALKDGLTGAAESAVPFVGKIGELTSGLSGAQVAAIGAGAAFVGVGALGVSAATDMDSAMNSFIASTGKGAEETERYQGILENIYANNYGESFEDIASAMGDVTKQLGDMDVLGPLISQFVQLLSPIVSLISAAIQPLISAFIELVQTAIQPLMPVIQALMSVFTTVMNSISGNVTGVINNITNIFRNLIDFVKNVFTGNWRGAWNNVKEIFRNAVSGLAAIFKAQINAIVDGWNNLASSIGSVSVPEWVPIAGGKSFSLPKMSRLKVGLDYVPHDMFPAYLDEGEWVLTKEEANLLRSLGGIEGLLSVVGNASVDSQKNIVVQSGNAAIDYDRLGKSVASALIDAGVGFKCDEVVFARLIKDLMDYV